MKKEKLISLFHDVEFQKAFDAHQEVRDQRKELLEAVKTLEKLSTPIDRAVIDDKANKLDAIRSGYDRMLEEIWGVTWHCHEIIEKYLGSTEGELDALPEYIK